MTSTIQNDTILRERYKLTNKVGQGGMGSVYRAEDLRLPGRLCAIKEIKLDPDASLDNQAQSQEQFLKEASILAQHWSSIHRSERTLAPMAGGSHPGIKVVVLSTYEAAEYQQTALDAGAVAFISKSEFGPDALEAVWDTT